MDRSVRFIAGCIDRAGLHLAPACAHGWGGGKGAVSFILVAALMVLAATACVAVPLWRARPKQQPSTDAANRAVHAARVEELDRDLLV
ncbi:MAG: c-type cytochrome biogenesis protein CcmI, partial [Gammaproteobacteria bacterium]